MFLLGLAAKAKSLDSTSHWHVAHVQVEEPSTASIGDTGGVPPGALMTGHHLNLGSCRPESTSWRLDVVDPHLRMHKPVVVLAAGHSAPSGAPAEQTTEASTLSSLQATVFSPLTIRKPVMPAGPAPPLMCADHRLGLSCSEDRVHNAPRGILSVCSDVHVKRPISRLFSAATATSRQRIGGLDQQMSPQQKQKLTAGLHS
jgi:hypothetical protein